MTFYRDPKTGLYPHQKRFISFGIPGGKPRNRRERRKFVRYAVLFGLPIHEIVRATGIKREKLRQIERGHARAVVRAFRSDIYKAYSASALGIGVLSRREVTPGYPLFVNPMRDPLADGRTAEEVQNTPGGGRVAEVIPGEAIPLSLSRRIGKSHLLGVGFTGKLVDDRVKAHAASLDSAMMNAILGADTYEQARMEAAGWDREESPVERMARMGRLAWERNR